MKNFLERFGSFLTTFNQLTARLKNFLIGWLLILGLKEGLVKMRQCAIKVRSYQLDITYGPEIRKIFKTGRFPSRTQDF